MWDEESLDCLSCSSAYGDQRLVDWGGAFVSKVNLRVAANAPIAALVLMAFGLVRFTCPRDRRTRLVQPIHSRARSIDSSYLRCRPCSRASGSALPKAPAVLS